MVKPIILSHFNPYLVQEGWTWIIFGLLEGGAGWMELLVLDSFHALGDILDCYTGV